MDSLNRDRFYKEKEINVEKQVGSESLTKKLDKRIGLSSSFSISSYRTEATLFQEKSEPFVLLFFFTG